MKNVRFSHFSKFSILSKQAGHILYYNNCSVVYQCNNVASYSVVQFKITGILDEHIHYSSSHTLKVVLGSQPSSRLAFEASPSNKSCGEKLQEEMSNYVNKSQYHHATINIETYDLM